MYVLAFKHCYTSAISFMLVDSFVHNCFEFELPFKGLECMRMITFREDFSKMKAEFVTILCSLFIIAILNEKFNCLNPPIARAFCFPFIPYTRSLSFLLNVNEDSNGANIKSKCKILFETLLLVY